MWVDIAVPFVTCQVLTFGVVCLLETFSLI